MKSQYLQFEQSLVNHIKARFPILYITTWEEERLIELIDQMVNEKNHFKFKKEVFQWSVTKGIENNGKVVKPDIKNAISILEYIENYKEDAVFILKDLYFDLKRCCENHPNQVLIRKIKDLVYQLKMSEYSKTIIIVGHDIFVPDDLSKQICLMDFELPNNEEIQKVYKNIIDANKDNEKLKLRVDNEDLKKLSDAASGLTLHEAENALALAITRDGTLSLSDIEAIKEEKKQLIKRSGILEFLSPKIDMKSVGGLNNIKNWIYKRSNSWGSVAKQYNLPSPKGVLITGVPGCGKSLIAKSLSSEWNLPLLRFDVGSVFGGIVGSSEANMRKVIQTAEAIAPCVLWIDEIEKGFTGIGSSGDSGTSTRIFGTFLSWMQEKRKFVFVVATANKIDLLPPELMRKGRFDEIFFVDLPTKVERAAIFKVHLRKKLKNKEVLEADFSEQKYLDILVEKTEGFTGAEIEQVVISALFEAFDQRRKLTFEDFEKSIENTVPLKVTQAENIEAIRQWANVRAVSATTINDNEFIEEAVVVNKDGFDDFKPSPNSQPRRGGRTIDF
ncbi:AAA family ATPase [Tenacibaculum sp. 190524A05c]|uniref:AAA family ATPase n=1 Tax=Tenacibaculum platacis TaxID=3137852 RepID=UPI0031FB3F45